MRNCVKILLPTSLTYLLLWLEIIRTIFISCLRNAHALYYKQCSVCQYANRDQRTMRFNKLNQLKINWSKPSAEKFRKILKCFKIIFISGTSPSKFPFITNCLDCVFDIYSNPSYGLLNCAASLLRATQ